MPLAVQTLVTLRCPICEGRPARYLPIPAAYVAECRQRGVQHPLDGWEMLNLESYLCPECGATDRDRLQVLFLRSWLEGRAGPPSPYSPPSSGPEEGVIRVLEIAPSPPVSNWLRRQPRMNYRSADLYMSGADDRVDITDMAGYPDESFDLVICSHVLEHIPDDRRAMREIRRILAPKGTAMLLVPISKQIEEVDEDPTLSDEAERWRRFGQGDHVRIYCRNGFRSRLEEAGLRVAEFHPGPESAEAAGLAESNCLYLGHPAVG